MTTTNNTQALETLTKDEVMSLLNETLDRKKDINDYLSILKGTYTSWDGDTFDGYIVCHYTKKPTSETANDFMPTYVENRDYYFMEVTLKEVDNPFKNSHLWEPTFHKLIPISENYNCVSKFIEGSTTDLCNYIVANVCRDKWNYTEVPMSEQELKEARKRDWYWYRNHTTKVCPLTYNDIYCHWSTPLTEEEKSLRAATLKAKEKALLNIFSDGDLPKAESEPWYSILSTGYGSKDYNFECKVVNILRNRGFNVQIVGEKDSFGWVTRGISVDGNIMAIY